MPKQRLSPRGAKLSLELGEGDGTVKLDVITRGLLPEVGVGLEAEGGKLCGRVTGEGHAKGIECIFASAVILGL